MIRLRIVYRHGELYVSCNHKRISKHNITLRLYPTRLKAESLLYLQFLSHQSHRIFPYYRTKSKDFLPYQHTFGIVKPLLLKLYRPHLFLYQPLQIFLCASPSESLDESSRQIAHHSIIIQGITPVIQKKQLLILCRCIHKVYRLPPEAFIHKIIINNRIPQLRRSHPRLHYRHLISNSHRQ